MGTGHVMRCLALAQAWQDAGGQAIFLMASGETELQDRLLSEDVEIASVVAEPGSAQDASFTVAFARDCGAKWVVVDGYAFDTTYQWIIKDNDCKLLAVDDCGHARYYHSDFVLNQNIYAREHLYRGRQPYTRLLLGTRYALLRREFAKWRQWKREIPPLARNLLVTFGGGDSKNVTAKVLEGLQDLGFEDLQVTVVLGSNNLRRQELEDAFVKSRFPIHIVERSSDMAALMAESDLAIAASGSTSWELAFMGLPSLLIATAANQSPIAGGMARAGAAANLGWHKDLSPTRIAEIAEQWVNDAILRERAARNARELVDGQGSHRVAEALMGQ
jgi:UDP-2,4-diacetamido-2,4,6-trideoxy-beta-L-altropyranose hydrolase